MGKRQRIGILTAGGDSPGLNAAIRAVGKAALGVYGMEFIGLRFSVMSSAAAPRQPRIVCSPPAWAPPARI